MDDGDVMGIGVTELIVLFLIILLLFGTKKLKNIGGDLGFAIKSFRSAVNDEQGHTEQARETNGVPKVGAELNNE